MTIDGRISGGFVLLCDRCDEAFLARRLAPSVECPHCGHTDFPAEMVADYLMRNVAAPEAMAVA